MNRLQTRIFALFMGLLLALQALAFWLSFNSNQRLEQQQLQGKLSVARLVFNSEYDNRNQYLDAFAVTAAKDFGLKEIFIDGDRRSFLVALNNHRQRINANVAIAVSAEGKVLAELVTYREEGQLKVRRGRDQDTEFRHPLGGEFDRRETFYRLDGRLYQLKFAPIASGGDSVIGWIGFGYLIDDTLAANLSALTGLNTGFVLSGNNFSLVGQSQPLSEQEIPLLRNFIEHESQSSDFLMWKQPLGEVDGQRLYAFMLQKQADILGALETQWWQQLALLLAMIPLSMTLAYLIARSVTRPIQNLIAQAQYIAGGNYETQVSVGNSLEMQQLAREFTQMQQAILAREQTISHRAFHDPMTELPNRNGLERLTASWFDGEQPLVVFLLNIRRTSEVNVTLGHAVGDEVIRQVARRLTQMPGRDLVSRLSGDEFVLIYRGKGQRDLSRLYQEIQAAFEQEYSYHGIVLHLQFTLGASLRVPGVDLVTLLRQADTAMHHARSQKLHWQLYHPEIDLNTIERLQLVNELKHALEHDELVLFFQPKLDLRLGQVTEVEALVRWQHPQNGLIPPDVFIPIAEKTGQMNAMTQWVLTQAARQYRRWMEEGIRLHIAVNISPENFKQGSVCDWIQEILKRHGMPVEALTLEITEETVMADPTAAIAMLTRMRQIGLTLSIDDYGTGYSSLSQLKQLPVHELKIDRSFVQQLMTQSEDRLIVASTISLAHSLGLSVVAEGVEDVATLEWLAAEGCELVQGFYLSRPVCGTALGEWLKRSPWKNTEAVA